MARRVSTGGLKFGSRLPAFEPEQRFVLNCLSADVERATSSIAEVKDFERLIGFALRHEVVGEVALFTKHAGIELPEAIRAGLDSYATRLRDRNRLLVRESLAIMKTLARLGVPAIVAKGAVWDSLYRDVDTPRTSKDLDVYIAADNVRDVVERIVDRYDGVSYDPLDETLRHLHHHTFWAPGAGTAIELHWDVAAPWHNLRFDLSSAISRSRMVSLGGGEVRTLKADDAIIFCALELAKDSWSSLKKLLDFAAAVRAGGLSSLVDADRMARGLRCSRILRVSLYLSLELGFLSEMDCDARHFSEDAAAFQVKTVSLHRLAREGARPSLHRRAVEGLTLSLKHDRRPQIAHHLWRIIVLYRLRGWLGARYR